MRFHKSIPSCTWIAAGLAGLASSAVPRVSRAGGEGYCGAYAEAANTEQESNLHYQCGNSGASWSTNRKAHHDWCIAALQESVEQQAVYRLRRLRACSLDALCSTYAQIAAHEDRIREGMRCPLSGPRWISDPRAHYEWCLHAPQDGIEREALARMSDLQSCQRCADYANRAVAQNINYNIPWRCGGGAPRWSSDFNQHFRWCWDAKDESLRSEESSRREDLKSCRGRFPP